MAKKQIKRPKITAAVKAGGGPTNMHHEHGFSRTTLHRITHKGEPIEKYDFALKLHKIHPEFTAAEYCDESRDIKPKAKRKAKAA